MMAPNKRQPDDERAKKTLYVTGFNPKLITKHLLKELFSQGGPVADVTLCETHAYVLFQHIESVSYCLALYNDIEIFGDKLRLKPRTHAAGNPYKYLDYLLEVRRTLRDEYAAVKPPSLPRKRYSNVKKNSSTPRHHREKKHTPNKQSDIGSRAKQHATGNGSDNKDTSVTDETKSSRNTSATDVSRDGKQRSRKTFSKKPSEMLARKKGNANSTQVHNRKRGGKRKAVGNKKLQKRIKFLT